MRLSSPSFLLAAARDEIFERCGVYPAGGRRHRGHYLDHRSLGLSADANGGTAYVMWGRRKNWRPASYLKPGGTVFWVRTDELGRFARQVLPVLDHRFVLVTGEADYSPLKYDREMVETLLASDKLAHWFCAQSDIPEDVGKHTPMPLGLPYPYRNDIFFAPNLLDLSAHLTVRYGPEQFDRRLAALVAKRKPLAARKFLALADFALNNTSRAAPWGETRAAIGEMLRANPLVSFPKARVPQFALYELYADHAFVISPFGRGLDCYRTWEALLMGAIPIVKRSPLDPVFRDLPVALVEDWSEVNPANMARWAQALAGGWQDGRIDTLLTLSHWVSRIREKAARIGA